VLRTPGLAGGCGAAACSQSIAEARGDCGGRMGRGRGRGRGRGSAGAERQHGQGGDQPCQLQGDHPSLSFPSPGAHTSALPHGGMPSLPVHPTSLLPAVSLRGDRSASLPYVLRGFSSSITQAGQQVSPTLWEKGSARDPDAH